MINTGLSNICFGVRVSEGVYGEKISLGAAKGGKMEVPNTENVLYADNAKYIVKNSVTGGTIEITVVDTPRESYALITGHKLDPQTKTLIKNINDQAPNIGISRIISQTTKDDGEFYTVSFLKNVKFAEAIPEEKTKEESIEFGNNVFNGNVIPETNGDYEVIRDFDKLEDAIAYQETLFGTPANPAA